MMIEFVINRTWNGKPIEHNEKEIQVSMEIFATEGDLRINITAPYYHDAPPDSSMNLNFDTCRYPNLWDYEVVEIFISSCRNSDLRKTPYLEIIVGPHSHYLIISHSGQGNWSECDDTLTLHKPLQTHIDQSTSTWTSSIHIPCEYLPEPDYDPDNILALIWKFNAFAIHGTGEFRRYLAYQPVPGDTPNYHQLNSFVPLKLFEKKERFDDLYVSLNKLTVTRHSRSPSSPVAPMQLISSSTETAKSSSSSSTVLITEFNAAASHSLTDCVAADNIVYYTPHDQAEALTTSPNSGCICSTVTATSSTHGNAILQFSKSLMGMNAVQQNASLSSSSNIIKSTETVTEAAARLHIDSNNRRIQLESYMSDIYSLCTSYLSDSEFVSVYGLVKIRQGWSYSKRILCLTSRPRLLLLSPAGEYRGAVPWSMTDPPSLSVVDDHWFAVTPKPTAFGSKSNQEKCFHFCDPVLGSEHWVRAIHKLASVWESYAVHQLSNTPVIV